MVRATDGVSHSLHSNAAQTRPGCLYKAHARPLIRAIQLGNRAGELPSMAIAAALERNAVASGGCLLDAIAPVA